MFLLHFQNVKVYDVSLHAYLFFYLHQSSGIHQAFNAKTELPRNSFKDHSDVNLAKILLIPFCSVMCDAPASSLVMKRVRRQSFHFCKPLLLTSTLICQPPSTLQWSGFCFGENILFFFLFFIFYNNKSKKLNGNISMKSQKSYAHLKLKCLYVCTVVAIFFLVN